jgi:hypothetical protein
MAVHHVEVQTFDASRFETSDFISQPAKIAH